MKQRDSNSYTDVSIEVGLKDIGLHVASDVFKGFTSEAEMERMGRDIARSMSNYLKEKAVEKHVSDVRKKWMLRNPPNHAGFYYCHLCAGWVHVTQCELDHIEPKGGYTGRDRNRDDNLRPAHTWPVTDERNNMVCPGNRGKGSATWPSATLDIRPEDEPL